MHQFVRGFVRAYFGYYHQVNNNYKILNSSYTLKSFPALRCCKRKTRDVVKYEVELNYYDLITAENAKSEIYFLEKRRDEAQTEECKQYLNNKINKMQEVLKEKSSQKTPTPEQFAGNFSYFIGHDEKFKKYCKQPTTTLGQC